LLENTQYYYRVRAESISWQTVNSNTISQSSAFSLGITKQGDGSGVTSMNMIVSSNITLTISGAGRFYSDPAGTLDESTSLLVTSGGLRTLYMRCPIGTGVINFSDSSKVTRLGGAGGGWTPGGSNSPTIGGNPLLFTNLTYFEFTSGNTFNLVASELPSGITYFVFSGVGITGAVSDLPPGLTYFLVVNNSLSGNISDISAALTYFLVDSGSSIQGDLADIPVGVTFFSLATTGIVTGDFADLPVALTYFYCSGAAVTFGGDIADLPATLQRFYIFTTGVVNGDIADLPAGLLYFGVTNNSALSGDVIDLPVNLVEFIIAGGTTINCDVNDLPASIITFSMLSGNLSGRIDEIPAGITYLQIVGSSMTDYTAGRAWAANMQYVVFLPNLGFGLTTAEVDNLLIDLDAGTWAFQAGNTINIAGNNAARSAASNAAVASLVVKLVTVTTN
jgi:hypothetical protein